MIVSCNCYGNTSWQSGAPQVDVVRENAEEAKQQSKGFRQIHKRKLPERPLAWQRVFTAPF